MPGRTGQRPQVAEGGFPHSEILGSKLVRSSPRLIAAYHVLHRLSAPRHPPNALITLDRSHDPCAPALADNTDQSFPYEPLGSNSHGQNFKDHGSRPSGRSDPKARPVQTIRSFMLQRARSIMQALKPTQRWPVSSQDRPERVIILFTMSNNPTSRDGRGNSF